MDYQRLWDWMVINPDADHTLRAIAAKLVAHQEIYERVAEKVGCPWYFIAPIHYRESSINFETHLHNGDSLRAKTIHVPMGRPEGTPPFRWEDSALDALKLRKIDKVIRWNLPTLLEEFEAYNGFGYKKYHPSVLSPYLWSGTNHYKIGKYSSDGHFDPTLKDKQMGCAPILRYITDKTLGIAL